MLDSGFLSLHKFIVVRYFMKNYQKENILTKIISTIVAAAALVTVANAGSLTDMATSMVKEKAEKKVQEKATEMATEQAKKSLKDGSLKEKAIKKATEVADKQTGGKASKAVEAVKSLTK